VGLGLAARSSEESGPWRCVAARAPGALAAWSPRAVLWRCVVACELGAGQRGGTLAGGPVVASRRQGTAGELAGATGRTPSKAVGGGAHLSSGAAWRQWRASGSGVQRRRDSFGDRW
jgi:hypothetical protein